MSESKPSLQIDNDWKRQAQQEKERLAEQERAARQTAAPATTAPVAGGDRDAGRSRRDLPPPSFGTLVQSLTTQILYYLGELAPSGGEPTVSLDMAKHHIDTLAILEEKTRGNLDADEKRMLDAALYETRMRYVSVAQQFIR